jgi:cytochrome oxidase Cu insertion factor (SCO1/SenC/PrrC family)
VRGLWSRARGPRREDGGAGGRPRSVWSLLLVLPVVLLVLVAGCGSTPGSGSQGSTDPSTQGAPGVDAAPGFSGATLDGRSVDLDTYKGKPLVLVFTASW